MATPKIGRARRLDREPLRVLCRWCDRVAVRTIVREDGWRDPACKRCARVYRLPGDDVIGAPKLPRREVRR